MKKNKKNIIFTTIAFCFGIFFSNIFPRVNVFADLFNPENLYKKVWSIMEEKYPFTEPSEEEKYYESIMGLVNAYKDPYSEFFPPQKSTTFQQNVIGHFGGIGVEIQYKMGYLFIVSPLRNSPAEKVGILPRDVITHIDGKEVNKLSLNEAVNRIRGEINTFVKLTVLRTSTEEILDFEIKRGRVDIPTLSTSNRDEVFVISLYNFNKKSEEKFKKALIEFQRSEKKKLLLDLRNNPGGYLSSAINIASYFLDKNKVIVKEDFGDNKKEEVLHYSKGFDLLNPNNYELFVLINSGSASASEIVAGALQDHGRAMVLGKTSYGKGSVQEFISLDNGAALKVTIAKWLTPKGNQISEKGIKPDIILENKIDKKKDLLELSISAIKI